MTRIYLYFALHLLTCLVSGLSKVTPSSGRSSLGSNSSHSNYSEKAESPHQQRQTIEVAHLPYEDERLNPAHTQPHPAALPNIISQPLVRQQQHQQQQQQQQQMNHPTQQQQQHAMHPTQMQHPSQSLPHQQHSHPQLNQPPPMMMTHHPPQMHQPPHSHPRSHPHPPHRTPLTNISLPKQQVATVLNSMTQGGTHLQKMSVDEREKGALSGRNWRLLSSSSHSHSFRMTSILVRLPVFSRDGYDLANLHAMNVRYLQQVASQRSYAQQPNQPNRPIISPPSQALFAAKM